MREAKRRGEVPKLDGDPFLDAQEWEIENLAISVKGDGPKATGEVAFDNFGKPHQAHPRPGPDPGRLAHRRHQGAQRLAERAI